MFHISCVMLIHFPYKDQFSLKSLRIEYAQTKLVSFSSKTFELLYNTTITASYKEET